LKSRSRGEDKTGKTLKGKGWLLHESPRSVDENLEIYTHVRALFDIEHPVLKPLSEKYTTIVQKDIKTS